MKQKLWFFVVFLVYSSIQLADAGDKFFFNHTSLLQVSSATLPLNSRFDFRFRTCEGGVLLSQVGNLNNDFIEISVSKGIVNYTISVKPPYFTPSQLTVRWKVGGVENFVHVGNELDKSQYFTVRYVPGIGDANSTISLDGPITSYSASIPRDIRSFVSGGPLYAGGGSGGVWFSGCMESGTNVPFTSESKPTEPTPGCPLDSIAGCPNRKACDAGFTGDYCEINIDECASAPCHSYSTCLDGVNNYTCLCGPRWTGRDCSTNLGNLCDPNPCQNGGVCKETFDRNNYTCACPQGYTGWNCNGTLHPCETLNCNNGGTCQKQSNASDDYVCVCVTGFNGIRCEQNIDDCASLPCKHGKCVDGVNNHTCNCPGSGYEGPKCDVDINECKVQPGPCLNGGTCDNYLGTYGCSCKAGYRGKNCQENIDECDPNPCLNGGTCVDGINGFNCSCFIGFTGERCETNIDDCVSNTCNANQDCVDQVNNYTCVCKPGFTGSDCSVDILECLSNPCRHGGTCHEGVNGYNCTCLPRFNGTHCELDTVNDCNSSPCLNNGTCVDDVGFFNCTCPKGFDGVRCENKSDSCHPNPCKHGASCNIVNETDFTCACPTGYTGKTCDIDIDDCASALCVANATCVDLLNNYTCKCPSGYHGDLCQFDINECESNPCRNNGTCKNEEGKFTCTCLSGFNGTFCEVNIDDCPANGCNNGTCIDGINNYTCQCFIGFEGRHCEKDIDECSPAEVNDQNSTIVGFAVLVAILFLVIFGLIVYIVVLKRAGLTTRKRRSEAENPGYSAFQNVAMQENVNQHQHTIPAMGDYEVAPSENRESIPDTIPQYESVNNAPARPPNNGNVTQYDVTHGSSVTQYEAMNSHPSLHQHVAANRQYDGVDSTRMSGQNLPARKARNGTGDQGEPGYENTRKLGLPPEVYQSLQATTQHSESAQYAPLNPLTRIGVRPCGRDERGVGLDIRESEYQELNQVEATDPCYQRTLDRIKEIYYHAPAAM